MSQLVGVGVRPAPKRKRPAMDRAIPFSRTITSAAQEGNDDLALGALSSRFHAAGVRGLSDPDLYCAPAGS